MTFDGEHIEDLTCAEIVARLHTLWNYSDMTSDEDTDAFTALLDELSDREL